MKFFIASSCSDFLSANCFFPKLLIKIRKNGLEKTLNSLTLHEKIGQMINVSINTDYANFNSKKFAEIRRQIEQNKVGGFTLFGKVQFRGKLPVGIQNLYELGAGIIR